MSNDFSPWRPDLGNGRYKNPILYADYSDPDMVRVGDDFYMVSSSFNHMPALPILHSRDLINWTLVNHVFPHFTLPEYDRFQPGKGVWAPSIRYHAGKFWVFFSTPDEGIFMCQADDPRGEWTQPHCLKQAKGWIDPCPFWDDDGSAWLVHAFAFSRCSKKHLLQLCRMSPDGRALLDEGTIIFDGSVSQPTLEGPKVYKRNGLYYIFAPAGGVPTGWQTVLRSHSLHGEWESKIVLHQGNTAVNGPHQGGWVELDNGECWFAHFQDQHAYGRVVHLQPMHWQDDWPVIGHNQNAQGIGEPVMEWVKPQVKSPAKPQQPQTSDRFTAAELGLQWQWQATPQKAWFSMKQPGLSLFCQPLPLREGALSLYDAPNLLLQKFPAAEFVVTVNFSAQLGAVGERCGLIVYGERYGYLGLEKTPDGLALISGFGWMTDALRLQERQSVIMPWNEQDDLRLRVTVRDNALCEFGWSRGEEAFIAVDETFAAGPGKWVGAKVGLYALATEAAATPGAMQVASFLVTGQSDV